MNSSNIKNSVNKIQDFYASTGIKKTDSEMINEFSKKTKDFVNKLSNSTIETIKDFLSKETKQIPLRNSESKLYQYDNLLFTITNGKTAYDLEHNLKFFQKENVMPKYIKYLELGNDEFLTILEGDKEALIPYREARSLLTDKNKQLFKLGLKNIASNTGYVNKEIFANREPLFVGKENNNLIYGDWLKLSKSEADLKQYYLNQIEKIPL